MKTLIKTCGLFRDEDIDYANALSPDFVGFVFAKSKREVSLDKAKKLKRKLNENILSVGVFLDAEIDFILESLKRNIIEIAQLHGEENDDYIENLKSKTDAKIIKAVRVKSVKSILASKYCPADFLLLDNIKGGSGKRFEWSYLREALESGFDRKYFLAGGLNRDNILQALDFKPYCIDLSGGLETDGVKDFDKMKKIMEILRSKNE